MSTYSYTKTADFASGLISRHLHNDVEAGTMIPNLIGVNVDDDNVSILFDAALSAGEQTELDGIVTNYTYVTPAPTIRYTSNVQPEANKYWSSTFTLLCDVPVDTEWTIYSIGILGFMDPSMTDYTIRISDALNGNQIGIGTYTNTGLTINTITGLTNLPSIPGVIEMSIKCSDANKNKPVKIKNISICYI